MFASHRKNNNTNNVLKTRIYNNYSWFLKGAPSSGSFYQQYFHISCKVSGFLTPLIAYLPMSNSFNLELPVSHSVVCSGELGDVREAKEVCGSKEHIWRKGKVQLR